MHATTISDATNCRVALDNFLLSYRTAAHATTGHTPAELMFGRNIKDKLPTIYEAEASPNYHGCLQKIVSKSWQ